MTTLLLLAAYVPLAETPPNLLVILVDDMGFSDLGCTGSEIPTPSIDRIAAEGLLYPNFTNTGRCCPTRASLLTGQWSHAVGVGHMNEDTGLPAYRGRLNASALTFGEVLQEAGYFTAAVGKWHVGSQTAALRPNARGFDRFFGVPEGGGFYYRTRPGRTVRRDETIVFSASNQPPEGWYTTHAWADATIEFIDAAAAADRPFAIYLAHNAPHFPLQADRTVIQKYRGTYAAGWDEIRRERLTRQKAAGLFPEDTRLSPRPDNVKPWSETTPAERDRFDHTMACYAATIDLLDRSVGRVLDVLDDRGLAEDTFVMFLSDNGASDEGGVYGRLKGDVPGDADSSVFAGRAWATASNTPLRRHKKSAHEGGIRTPLLVRWPGGFAATGELREEPGHVVDILPTLLDVAGAKYPETRGGESLRPPDGRSLRPTFDRSPLPRRRLFWSHEGNEAIREGDLKLVRGWQEPWELFDLAADPTELRDLAAERPEDVRRLTAAHAEWSADIGASWADYTAARAAKKAKDGRKRTGQRGAAKP